MMFVTFLVSAIRFGMVLLLGSTGETITEKAGHLNLGIPGVMCVGAACGCVAEAMYFDICGGKAGMTYILAILIPLIATILGGVVMGLIYSFLTVTLHANQNVTGLAMTTFGVGVSDYMITTVQGYKFTAGSKFFTSYLPFADNLGWFGKLFFSYGIMIYLAVAIAIITSYVLNKTRVGLHLRAVGENPATADATGINVTKYRYIATCIGCAVASLGGLVFVMDYQNGNWEYIIDAIGWLSVALVIFMVWKPTLGILCSFIFGAFYVASSYIPGISLAAKEIFKILPYFVTILVLIFISIINKRENQPPASLGINYYREER